MQKKVYLADVAGGHDNNFNLIRMLAATGVIWSHAFPLSLGSGRADPIATNFGGPNFGTICVMVFFSISGFFIARSFSHNPDVRSFLIARALRLFPALIVCLIITIVAVSFVTTAAGSIYWGAVPEYFVRNSTLFLRQPALPGVFEANPFPRNINGSLWTLSYEVSCYLSVLGLGLIGVLSKSRKFFVVLITFCIVYLTKGIFQAPFFLDKFLELGLAFLIGVSFWIWRESIILSPIIAILLLSALILSFPTPLFYLLFWLALVYSIFLLGYLKIPLLQKFNSLGDYSYGIYIYAWPAQQFCSYFGATSPLLNIVTSFPAVLLLSVLSWHIIEHPALKMKKKYQSAGLILKQS